MFPTFEPVVWDIESKSASYDCILATFSTKLLTWDFDDEKLINSPKEAVE